MHACVGQPRAVGAICETAGARRTAQSGVNEKKASRERGERVGTRWGTGQRLDERLLRTADDGKATIPRLAGLKFLLAEQRSAWQRTAKHPRGESRVVAEMPDEDAARVIAPSQEHLSVNCRA